MKTSLFSKMIRRTIFFIVLSYSAFSLSAQSLPDFSGEWIQDQVKSDDFYKDFNVKTIIKQDAGSVTITTTFSDKAGKEMVKRESAFSLDGKETTGPDGEKRSAKWSPDKKSLILTDTKDYGGDIVGTITTYSYSPDGKVLTVKTSDIKPGALSITQYFNKKQD